ncbi:MAG: CinA family protein [Candidatus Heimdallarchaeota archaeon]|nr:CinA family protein [Candidatus Heimdallarchaeota archaeon]
MDKQTRKILFENNWTLATAESCSGGLLAHSITNSSGSSNYFSFGYITYSDEAKISELNVPREVIKKFSSYSKEVVELMAEGVRKKTNSTFGIAITGIAPPGDPTSSLDTGTVFVGISTSEECYSFAFSSQHKTRLDFKNKTVKTALNLIKDAVQKFTWN